METSGKNKRPANPATIQSDAAGNPDKPIYQEKGDSFRRDDEKEPGRKPRETGGSAGTGGDSKGSDDAGGTPKENREKPGEQPRQREEKPKDDVHSAPESGDKLP